jgi:hypothetical protein
MGAGKLAKVKIVMKYCLRLNGRATWYIKRPKPGRSSKSNFDAQPSVH